jgi:hypothetical protein
MGKLAGQRVAKPGEKPLDGALAGSGPVGRGRVFASGAVTSETAAAPTAPPGLADAVRAFTRARYGRVEKFGSDLDEAVDTAIRITKQQQSAHSLPAEWGRNFTKSVVDLRRKVWA